MGYIIILGSIRVTRSNLDTDGPQILGDAIKKLDTNATWRPEFLHPCSSIISYSHLKTRIERPVRKACE
jgi:hypothetical protein